MAIQTIPGGLWIPAPVDMSTSGPAFTGAAMDATAEKVAAIIRAPKTGTLDQFGWRQQANSNTPDNGVRFSFQDVSGIDADGVVDQFRLVTSGFGAGAWLESGLITSDGTDTGTKRSVTAGELLACVVDYQAFVAGDNIQMSSFLAPGDFQEMSLGGAPYMRHFTAAWVNFAAAPTIALKYNDGAYYYVGGFAYPLKTLNTVTFNSGSASDEIGLIFQFPFTCQVGGCWIRIDLDNDTDLVLYDAASSALVTVALASGAKASTDNVSMFIPFAPQTITASTNYRLVLKPGASSISLYNFDVETSAHLGGVEGGANFHYTERADAGAWTNTTTKRPFMGLLVTGIDVASGGGGFAAAYA